MRLLLPAALVELLVVLRLDGDAQSVAPAGGGSSSSVLVGPGGSGLLCRETVGRAA